MRALISADLPNELTVDNRNMQNLLILTAFRKDKIRVMDYINRLDNYDGSEIVKTTVVDPYRLCEEAFPIYKKCGDTGLHGHLAYERRIARAGIGTRDRM